MDGKDIETHPKPKGTPPMCHGEYMYWDKYRNEWQCHDQLAHVAAFILGSE